jgi:hypothetical protein
MTTIKRDFNFYIEQTFRGKKLSNTQREIMFHLYMLGVNNMAERMSDHRAEESLKEIRRWVAAAKYVQKDNAEAARHEHRS